MFIWKTKIVRTGVLSYILLLFPPCFVVLWLPDYYCYLLFQIQNTILDLQRGRASTSSNKTKLSTLILLRLDRRRLLVRPDRRLNLKATTGP